MRFRFHLTNPAIFAAMWVALSVLVLHDIALRRAMPTVASSGVQEKVVTKEFVLVDDSGNTRARIGMSDKTNAPCVQLFDTSGQQRAQLRLNKDNVPSLRLYDSGGNVKSVMGFTLNDMQPTYVTFDANGVGRVENATRSHLSYATIHDEDLMDQYVTSSHATAPTYPALNSYPLSYQVENMPSQICGTVRSAELEAQAQAQQAEAQARQNALQAQQDMLRADQEILRARLATPRTTRDPFHPNYR